MRSKEILPNSEAAATPKESETREEDRKEKELLSSEKEMSPKKEQSEERMTRREFLKKLGYFCTGTLIGYSLR